MRRSFPNVSFDPLYDGHPPALELPRPPLPVAINSQQVSHFPHNPKLIKYAPISRHHTYRLPLPFSSPPSPPPPPPPTALFAKQAMSKQAMSKQAMSKQAMSKQAMPKQNNNHARSTTSNRLQATNSFHTTPRRAGDPRRTRTLRANTSPKSRVLAIQLSTTPHVSILLLPKKSPVNALLTAHTAASAHGHWRGVATSVRLPACITLPCHASELDTRLLRVRVFGGRRGSGEFVIPVRTVLGGEACVGVGKRGSLDVRGVVGSFNGWGLGVGLCAGMSVQKEVRGCLVRVKRVGGGRSDVGMGEWEFGREGYCRVNIVGDVLWFGIEEEDGNFVRLVFEMVKRGAFGGEQVVGEMQIGLKEMGKIGEGEVLKMGWWRGGVNVVLLAMVEMKRQTSGQLLLELRVTR